MANTRSPYYKSDRYGSRYFDVSNFLLWYWIFHDTDSEEYEEEYAGEPNTSAGGIFVTVGLAGAGLLALYLLTSGRRR